jgi:hypothetical protein
MIRALGKNCPYPKVHFHSSHDITFSVALRPQDKPCGRTGRPDTHWDRPSWWRKTRHHHGATLTFDVKDCRLLSRAPRIHIGGCRSSGNGSFEVAFATKRAFIAEINTCNEVECATTSSGTVVIQKGRCGVWYDMGVHHT